MKKVIILLIAAVLSVNLWADEGEYGDELKLTKSQEYAMKKPATRAFGSGSSMRENIATQKAADDARSALAQSLEMAIMRTAKKLSYDKLTFLQADDDGASMLEGGEKTRDFLKTVCQQVLKGTPVVKMDRFYKKKNRMFTIFVCVEYVGGTETMAEETVKEIKGRISEKDRARIDSELDKWENELKNELENQSDEIPFEDEAKES